MATVFEKLAFGERIEGIIASAPTPTRTLDDLKLPDDAPIGVPYVDYAGLGFLQFDQAYGLAFWLFHVLTGYAGYRLGRALGGPHVGVDMIWPLGVITRGLTSTEDAEIRNCLDTLRRTHAGTGFMHEAFHKDNPDKFTRSWFAWANTLFGEFIVHTADHHPALLK